MDFSEPLMTSRGYGEYVELDPALFPNVFVAYRTSLSEGTEVFHNDIRSRYNRGEKKVVQAMKRWATIAEEGRETLLAGDQPRLSDLVNENYDLRSSIYQISEGNQEMIRTARKVGASAKFAGSGGAIVGTYRNARQFQRLEREFEKIGVAVVRPRINA